MPRKKKIIIEEKKEKTKAIETKEKKEYIFTTGKRKTAIAQVKFSNTGQGEIMINKKDFKEYFPYETWQKIVYSPIELSGLKNYKIDAKVIGGGPKAQAESVRLGIAKVLVQIDPNLRKIFKPKGLLSRDARIKERKKPGLKRARRAPQWSKR